MRAPQASEQTVTLRSFLAVCTGTEQADWHETLDVLNTDGGLDVAHSFHAESRIEQATWERVLSVLPQPTWGEVQSRTMLVFQTRTLRGSAISATPSPKGRALSVGRFKSLLVDSGVYPTDVEASRFVRDLRSGRVPPVGYARQLGACDLGTYVMWCTFDPTGGGTDPFAGHAASAAGLRDALGLADTAWMNPDERDLIACVYTLPPDVPVRYPTIAEAYAGGDWNRFFLAAPPGAPWGETSGGRPEVVHDVIKGKHLTDPPGSPGVRSVRLVS